MKILIADDEKDILELLKERLTTNGHSVDTTIDGEKALGLIKLNKYDLAFLDHNMPGRTGLELIKYIKQNNIDTVTVMITGYPDITSSAAKLLGTDEYLTKPLKLKDIENIIDKYKNRKK